MINPGGGIRNYDIVKLNLLISYNISYKILINKL